jgi:hypothetical protein
LTARGTARSLPSRCTSVCESWKISDLHGSDRAEYITAGINHGVISG